MTGCTCTNYRKTLRLGPDVEAERVAAMVAQGVDQWEASRAVWGGSPLPPRTPAEVPAWVRLVMVLRSPWLRLPALGETGGARVDMAITVVGLAAWFGCLAVVLGWLR